MITGFHHIVLFCVDTERSKVWYERAGFPYKRGYGGMHWFGLGEGEVMLHPGGVEAAEGRPTIHVAVSDLDDLFERVKGAGLNPVDHQQPGAHIDEPVTRDWGDREFELQDPDGQWWAFTQAGTGA